MREKITTRNEQETLNLAKEITEKLLKIPKHAKVIFLKGNLGAGKTVFAKGVAKAIGIKKNIESPTFVFLREYEDGKVPFYHFDLYRINNPDELDELGIFEYLSKEGIILIEWAEKIENYAIPLIEIKITKTGKTEREIEINYAEDFNNK